MITKRSAPTRERILDAAVELFGRRGYHATSVGDIEEAAGLTPRRGGLYKHFESKEAVLEAAVERRGEAVDQLESLTAAAPLVDVGEELLALARLAFLEIGRDQDVFRIVMREGDNFPELRDRFHDRIVRSGHEQTAELLARLAERMGVEALDAEALAAVLLAPLINYRVLDTLFGRPPGGVEEDRYLEVWADNALIVCEAYGLVPAATTKEAGT